MLRQYLNQYLNQCLNQCLNPYLLLILSVVAITASIVNNHSGSEILILFLLSAIMILLAVRMARTRRIFATRSFGFFLILIGISILCDALAHIDWPPGFKTLFFISAALIRFYIFGYGWLSLTKTLATKQKVTDNTIITAIIAYLFIGILFSFVYLFIWHIDPTAFHISVARDYDFQPWNLAMYFSFVTLTTVGYGDIIPINRWVISVAMFEAITGAFYLTIIIARLVSLYGSSD